MTEKRKDKKYDLNKLEEKAGLINLELNDCSVEEEIEKYNGKKFDINVKSNDDFLVDMKAKFFNKKLNLEIKRDRNE